ncbi:ubiquitin-protein ligase E4 [Schizosaccharomyces japonicus yFS275]|uniref:Pre-mRNA-processing factor 19 n=1 Tax=Schizosaccharomyces japonicus (strain yFS275 / FY16936) TaxID=402676 RepID=B6K7R7_SCHJY|nr:ubiquitin-protein ligase E4 [Schizosaccharomyces japonicus yFS275]EEB09571.1 ubiquitin-protein ligase E4 [Schizosaccharomyces japonicus yFS275]
MFCAISGEAVREPVISRVSGNVFERRLVEQLVQENGKDPITQQEMSVDDLIPVKASKIVQPRPPSATSLPALLSLFQEEWDSVAIEQFRLRQTLSETRQELSSTLYKLDAAYRVISRLEKERDEAREALYKFSESLGGRTAVAGTPVGMQVDTEAAAAAASIAQTGGISKDNLRSIVEHSLRELTQARKKRKFGKTWVTADAVKTLLAASTQNLHNFPKSEQEQPVSDILPNGAHPEIVLVRRGQNVSCLNLSTASVMCHFEPKAAACAWFGETQVLVAALDESAVYVFDLKESETPVIPKLTVALPRNIRCVAGHPSGAFFAAASDNECYICSNEGPLYTVQPESVVRAIAFHPDGHLLAVGGENGKLEFYLSASGELATTLGPQAGSISQLNFAENGYWLATTDTTDNISIWDLRKAVVAHTLKASSVPVNIAFNLSSRLIAASTSAGVDVFRYEKPSKSWSLDGTDATKSALSVCWIDAEQALLCGSKDGSLSLRKA